MPQDSGYTTSEPYDEIIHYLFEDVSRLPIISNRAQELLLGIHLKAEHRAKAFNSVADDPGRIVGAIIEAIDALTDWCSTEQLPVPDFGAWVNEILYSRQHIDQLKKSRIYRFLRKVRELDDGVGIELVQEVIELLAMLPNKALSQLAELDFESFTDLPAEQLRDVIIDQVSALDFRYHAAHRAKQARLMLVQGYLRYVFRIARNSVGEGLDYTDLVQAGCLGLMRAAEKFDYREQARFGTYATSWIWQSIGRSLSDQTRVIRLPVHRTESINKLKKACLTVNGSIHPLKDPDVLHCIDILTSSERDVIRNALANREEMPEGIKERYDEACKRVQLLFGYDLDPLPLHLSRTLNGSASDHSETIELDRFIVDEHSPRLGYQLDQKRFLPIVIESLFTFLTQREREVLVCRFGLDDGQERTLEEVGEIFDLTRERIRQIEAIALKKLKNRMKRGAIPFNHCDIPMPDQKWCIEQPRHGIDGFDEWITNDKSEFSDWNWLDNLIERLPRGNWHAVSHHRGRGTRGEQLESALRSIGAPAHYRDVIEQTNDLFPGEELSESYGYARLISEQDTFILLGEGVFSLVAWEKQRSQEAQPTLPCCPLRLPDPPDFNDAFFESVFVARRELLTQPTTSAFLAKMFGWAEANEQRSRWLEQSTLSAYYLVGLIPYVFFYNGADPRLQDMLPEDNIQRVRLTCLQNLTERLVGMPEFWWLLQRRQPIRPKELGEEFADIHPHGLDDVLQRLYLLTSLGAAVRSSQGQYSLTAQGETAANEWALRPNSKFAEDSKHITGLSASVPDALFDFAFWE